MVCPTCKSTLHLYYSSVLHDTKYYWCEGCGENFMMEPREKVLQKEPNRKKEFNRGLWPGKKD